MRNRRIKLRDKIIIGFAFLILFFIASSLFTYYSINRSKNFIVKEAAAKDQSVSILSEFKDLVLRANMLTFYWVAQEKEDVAGKEELTNIHVKEFPEMEDALLEEVKNWEDTLMAQAIVAQLENFKILREKQNDIMLYLDIEEVYLDPLVMFDAELILESKIIPVSNEILVVLEEVLRKKKAEKELVQEQTLESFDNMETVIVLSLIVMIVIGVVFSILTAKRISQPIIYIKDVIDKLGRGEHPPTIKRIFSDEIGDISLSVNKLIKGLKETSAFAQAIGKGDFETDYKPLSRRDVLGNALLEMRRNLVEVAKSDDLRSWANEGYTEFNETLRKQYNTLEEMGFKILSDLVQYVGANQGHFFVVEGFEKEDQYMRTIASYAWAQKKQIDREVKPKEGLVGQAWVEKEHLLITDVPQNYIEVTSGLGDANPTCIIILPLLFNDTVYGAIEMAAFHVFNKHELDLMLRLSESIGSTLAASSASVQTKKLLEESQDKTEQLRMQEEEMRQNMEELSATQEEMARAIASYQERIKELEKGKEEQQELAQ